MFNWCFTEALSIQNRLDKLNTICVTNKQQQIKNNLVKILTKEMFDIRI